MHFKLNSGTAEIRVKIGHMGCTPKPSEFFKSMYINNMITINPKLSGSVQVF
jgi:hypothetical protein